MFERGVFLPLIMVHQVMRVQFGHLEESITTTRSSETCSHERNKELLIALENSLALFIVFEIKKSLYLENY